MKDYHDIISYIDTKEVFNNSHDAFIISDSEKTIRFFNKSALKIFGYTKEELIGRSILSLMSEDRAENYMNQMKEVLSGKTVSNIDSGENLCGKRKSGEIFPIELTYVASKSGSESYFISQIRDISERTKKENELSITSTALKIISEANRLLIRAGSEKEYAQGICDIITKIGGYSKSLLLYIEDIEDDRMLIPAAYSGYYPTFCVKQSFSVSSIKHSGSPSVIAIKDKKTDVCRNIKERGLWKYWKDSPEEMEFDSTISVPIFQYGEVTAVLRVYSYDPLSFEQHEVELLEELAKDISHGIRVLRERKELNSTTTTLRMLTEVGRLITCAESEEQYLKNLSRIIVNTGKFARSQLFLVKKIDVDDYFLKFVSLSADKENKCYNVDSYKLSDRPDWQSPTAISIREKKISICENISARGLWKYWVEKPEDLNFESTIAVPVIWNDEIISLIRIYSEDPFYFSKEKVKLLDNLSKDIARGLSYIKEKTERINSENKYRTLFQSSNDAIFIANADTGIIIDANKQAEELLGRNYEDIIGLHHMELHPEGYEEKYREIFKKHIEQGQNASDEFYIRTKTGKAIPVQASASVAYINGQKIIQGIFRDISKSRMEEEKVRNAQKMEALGTLSGGIAHDINNILSPIIGFTQIALLEKENKIKQSECLNEVLTAANRAKELVSQILTFCRKSDSEKKPHRIHNVVREVLKLISLSMPKNIKLEAVIDDNAEPIICDPVQIYQVVINLCTNAFHAMKDKGGILKVCLVRKGSNEIKSEDFEILPENYICLIVSDTGCGMSKTTLSRIFEPYFTTKSKEEGTGLGLSVVSGIVKEHGGEIYTRTYPDEGTYFKLSFPVAPKPEKQKPLQKSSGKSEHSLHIMAIDDEPQITFMLNFMFEELGHTAETFTDPEKAFASFKNDPSKYDLIITDQTMPGILGTELSKKILDIRPDTPIILNTGFSPVASKTEAKIIGIKQFLMKPLTISELSFAINESVKSNN